MDLLSMFQVYAKKWKLRYVEKNTCFKRRSLILKTKYMATLPWDEAT